MTRKQSVVGAAEQLTHSHAGTVWDSYMLGLGGRWGGGLQRQLLAGASGVTQTGNPFPGCPCLLSHNAPSLEPMCHLGAPTAGPGQAWGLSAIPYD